MNLLLAAIVLGLSGLIRLGLILYQGGVEAFACMGAPHPHHADSTSTTQETKRL